MEFFDEDKATKYILDNISTSKKYHQDDILEVIDIIWDYYEDHGLLSVDFDSDDADDEGADADTLVAHVEKMIRKDKGSAVAVEDIPAIVKAELAYEKLCDEL